MSEHVCHGCKHLQKSWRKGNASIIRWVCGRFKVPAKEKCIDYQEKSI